MPAPAPQKKRGMRRKKRVCSFCVSPAEQINYKDVAKFRRINGNCAKHQRELTIAIKRARHLALMPYTLD